MARIIIVDDDIIIQKVVRAILTKAKHSVVVAKDGHAALDQIKNKTFDLIISDANMPGGISGFNLVSTIRNYIRYKNTPIIFLTSRGEKEDVYRAIESGVNDYIVKPLDQDLFIAKVENLLLGKKGLNSFASTPVSESATLVLKLALVSVSEMGIVLNSPFELKPEMVIKINSPLFDLFGVEPPQLRVISSVVAPSDWKTFNIQTSFFELNEFDHKKIKQWIVSYQTPPHKKVS